MPTVVFYTDSAAARRVDARLRLVCARRDGGWHGGTCTDLLEAAQAGVEAANARAVAAEDQMEAAQLEARAAGTLAADAARKAEDERELAAHARREAAEARAAMTHAEDRAAVAELGGGAGHPACGTPGDSATDPRLDRHGASRR